MSFLLNNYSDKIITQLPKSNKFSSVIFDFDGTLSVLRKGWENIMHQYMYDEIVSQNKINIQENLKINEKIKDYVSKSTGIRTLEQMTGLIALIKEFNLVPEINIKDKYALKKGYLASLMNGVNERRQYIINGQKSADEFLISGSKEFLTYMSTIIPNIYLASGTDELQVKEEAKILGVYNYFNGGIFGSRDDIDCDIKSYLMNLLEKKFNNLESTLVIGDGPVEILEGKKRGAYCIGVASNEDTLQGINSIKRERLINAGADIIIGDYKNMDLFNYLFKKSKN